MHRRTGRLVLLLTTAAASALVIVLAACGEAPDFRENAARESRAAREELCALLVDAAAAAELRTDAVTDAAEGLARRVQVTLGGSLLAWATLRQGAARGWVREDLDALLAPLETSAGSP